MGGANPALRNLISGNIGVGLLMNGGTNQQIVGNLIGTNASGSAPIGNGAEGIVATSSAGNIHILNNVVSGNLSNGIGLYLTSGPATVQGNIIGLDASGSYALSNMQSGVAIDASNGNLIGGALAGNVISGNNFEGVYIKDSAGTTVQGNLIGRSSNNTVTIGNADMGILVEGSSTATLVGGIFSNEGNTVAGNSRGVIIRGSSDASTVLGNVIYDNTGMSIDLADDGATPNDPLDADTGVNGLQNTPVINQASISGGDLIIEFTLQSEANSFYRVEFFANPTLDVFGHAEGTSVPRIHQRDDRRQRHRKFLVRDRVRQCDRRIRHGDRDPKRVRLHQLWQYLRVCRQRNRQRGTGVHQSGFGLSCGKSVAGG